ncbi:hypothetical protein [Acrocarpospora sp. B8E8]|uniref:hypothetical protein n=1 Tax=Acrocarpospora sp. B8E8 TaxID=3153572 RepID=UPI00325DE482
MADDLRALIAGKVRERVRLRLGPNALKIAQLGGDIMLDGGEADDVADAVLEALAEHSRADWTPPLRHGNHSPLNVYAKRPDGSDVLVAVSPSLEHAARLIMMVNAFAEYENTIMWHTTCHNCASLLDQCYQADMEREAAELKLTGVKLAARQLSVADKGKNPPGEVERSRAAIGRSFLEITGDPFLDKLTEETERGR